MHSARVLKLCPPCTPDCTPVRSVRAMRPRVFPCGTIIASDRNESLRIKSPQLYRLSYRPKFARLCRFPASGSFRRSVIVSVVYPDPIAIKAVVAGGHPSTRRRCEVSA